MRCIGLSAGAILFQNVIAAIFVRVSLRMLTFVFSVLWKYVTIITWKYRENQVRWGEFSTHFLNSADRIINLVSLPFNESFETLNMSSHSVEVKEEEQSLEFQDPRPRKDFATVIGYQLPTYHLNLPFGKSLLTDKNRTKKKFPQFQ